MDVLLQPTEQTRSHRKAEVVNELLWVAAKRTFTSPGPWPLVRLVSGVVNELLGWQPKERSPSLAPGPLVFTLRFLTCLTITAFADAIGAPTRHELNRAVRRSLFRTVARSIPRRP